MQSAAAYSQCLTQAILVTAAEQHLPELFCLLQSDVVAGAHLRRDAMKPYEFSRHSLVQCLPQLIGHHRIGLSVCLFKPPCTAVPAGNHLLEPRSVGYKV